jgi:hypothetical protein
MMDSKEGNYYYRLECKQELVALECYMKSIRPKPKPRIRLKVKTNASNQQTDGQNPTTITG